MGRFKSEYRYFVRWVTKDVPEKGRVNLKVVGWQVCDRDKFDNIAVFENEDRGVCEAVSKMLNDNEEIERANNVRGT